MTRKLSAVGSNRLLESPPVAENAVAMTAEERVARFIEDREESHEDDDMPGDSDEFREYYVRTLIQLVKEAQGAAALAERRWPNEEVCEQCKATLARNDEYLAKAKAF